MKGFCTLTIGIIVLLLPARSLLAQNQDACQDCACLNSKALLKEREGLYGDAIRLYQAYSMCAVPAEQIRASKEIDRLQSLLEKQRNEARQYAVEANRAKKAEEERRKAAVGQTQEAQKQRKNALQKARVGHNTAKAQETKTRDASLAISIAARSAEGNRNDASAQELLSELASDTALYFYRSVPLVGLPAQSRLALSPDGSRLVAAGKDSVVRFYNPYTGRIVDSSGPLPGYILQIQFAEKTDMLLAYGTQWAVVLDFKGRIRSQFASSERGSRATIASDGTQWAHGDFEGRVYWHNSDSLGTLRHTFDTDAGRINSLAFSPDGLFLAVCTPNGAMLYDTAGVRYLQPPDNAGSGKAAAMSDSPSRRPPGKIPNAAGADTCAFSETGKELLLVGLDTTLRIWNIPAQQVTRLPGPEKSAIEKVAYLYADSIFVQLKMQGPTLRSPSCLPHREFSRRADETQHGWLAGQGSHQMIVLLSSASSGASSASRVRVFNRDGSYRTNFQVPNKFGKPQFVHYDPERGLALIFREGEKWTTVVFSNQRYHMLLPKTGDETNPEAVPFVDYLPASNSLVAVLPSPDQAVLLDSSGKVNHLNYLQGDPVKPVRQIALDPSGNLLLSYHTDGRLLLWRKDGGYVGPGPLVDQENPVRKAFFSPSHRHVMTLHRDYSLKIMNWKKSGKLEILDPTRDSVVLQCFDISANERWCAAGFSNGKIKLYEGRGRPTGIDLPNHAIAEKIIFFPKTDSLLVLTNSGEILLWDCHDMRKPLNRWRGAYNSQTKEWLTWEGMVLSPQGRYMLAWSDSPVPKLFDFADTTEIELHGHNETISIAAFSPDGQYLVTGSAGSACRLWDMQGITRAIWRGHEEGVTGLTFSPDGKYAVTLDGKGAVRAWDLPETLLAEKVEKFLLDDLAARGFIPEPEEALKLRRSDALRESAFNFLRLGDDSTAHFLFERLLRQSPGESADVRYAWYIAGGQTAADWDSLLMLDQASLIAIAERFKSIRAYDKAHRLYLKMLQAPDADLVRDIMQGYLEICPLAKQKIDTLLPVFQDEKNPLALVEYANILQDNGQETFARTLSYRAVQSASTPRALAALLSFDAQNPAIRRRIHEAVKTMSDTEKLELAYELMGERHFDLAYPICRELTQTPLYPQANMTLYEISLLSEGQYPFDTKIFFDADSAALRYYVDYLNDDEGPDLRDTLQLKLTQFGASSFDYIDLYEAGALPFSNLVANKEPDHLREFAFYFSSLALQTDDQCEKAGFYRQATALGDALLRVVDNADDRRQVARYYNSLGWRLILCGKFDTAQLAIERGLAVDPSYLYLNTNLPHAMLFRGNFEQARQFYLDNADRDFSQFDPDLSTLRDAYLDDFNTFKYENKKRPGFLNSQQTRDLALIEQELRKKGKSYNQKNR